MPSIDNRIVEMQFNNAQFEQGVNQSLGTLDKLKSALKLDNASKGFENVSSAANKLDFSGLSNAIVSVSLKFSALEVAAFKALSKIVEHAVDAGLRFAKSISIDQLVAGWSKYGDKVQSTATIMAATGESVEVVGSALEKLNAYTDETSANFIDMTNNIGKFTNAGVKLDTAVSAMQGITNWGYKAGATTGEMSRSMYNLSQALATGSVKLIDWKSVENANMATTEFKNKVIEVALATGTLKKSWDGTIKTVKKGTEVTTSDFNSALSEGWFSSDVLTSVLEIYGDFSTDIIELSEETGETVLDLMGAFDEFKEGNLDFTELANSINKPGISAEYLERAFRSMGTASDTVARRLVKQRAANKGVELSEEQLAEETEKMADALESAYIDSKNGVTDFSEVLRETGLTSKQLSSIFEEFDKNQTLSKSAFEAAQEYRTLRDAIDATKDAVSTGLMKSFELIFGNYEEAKRVWTAVGEALYSVFAAPLAEKNELLEAWHVGGGYESFVRAIENISETIINIKELVDSVFSDSFLHIGTEDVNGLIAITRQFELFTSLVKDISSKNFKFIGTPKVANIAKLSGIEEYEEGLANAIDRNETILNSVVTMQNIIEGIAHAFDLVKSVVVGVWTAVSPLFTLAKSVGGDVIMVIEAIAKRLGAMNEDEMQNGGIIGFFTKLRDIVGPIAEWLGGVFHTFAQTLANIIDPNVEAGFSDFGETFDQIFGKIGGVCKKVFPILSAIGRTIGTAIDIVVDKISEFAENASIQDFFDLLKGGASVGIFAGLAKLVSNIAGASGNLKDGGILGLIFGSGGDKKGGGIKETIKSLPEQIGEFAKGIGDSVKKFVDVEAFKAFGSALLMIAGALFILSMIPTESLGESLSLLALSMAAIVGVMELFAKSSAAESGKMLAAGVAFALLAGSLLILSAALLVFSLIPADKIESALGAMAGVLTEVGIALAAMQLMDPGKLLASALAMLILAPALLLMAAAFAVMSLIPMENLSNGLVAMAGVLGTTVAALMILSAAGPMAIAAAAALLILSPALIIMAAAIAILAAIPADKATSAVGTMLVVLLELVGALGVLSLIGPMVLVAAAALLILSPALILIATALLLLSLIPMEAVGTALIALGGALMIVVAAAWAVAPVVGPLLALAAAFLAIAAATVILGVGLTAIAIGIMALVAAGSILVTVVVGAFESLITSALGLVSNLFQLGADILQAIVDGIKSMIGDLPQVAQDIINGLVQGLLGMMSSVLSAAAEIGRGILGSIKGALGIASPSKEMISLMGYVGRGLEIGSEKVIDKAAQIGNAIGYAMADGTQEGLSSINDLYGSPTIRPITDLSNIQNGSFNGFGVPGAYASNAMAGIGSGIDAYRYGNQTTTNNSPIFNIYQQPGEDSEALARIINRELGRMYVR